MAKRKPNLRFSEGAVSFLYNRHHHPFHSEKGSKFKSPGELDKLNILLYYIFSCSMTLHMGVIGCDTRAETAPKDAKKMTNCTTEGEKPSDEQNIYNFFVGGLMLTLPYLFVWYLAKGNNFVETYTWYLHVALYAGGAIGILTAVAMGIKKRWPAVFENPPKNPEWLGFAGAGAAFVISIVGGLLDGWQTGLLLFWPSVFFSVCVVGGFHWLVYQVKRWWLNWLT